ncbi:hypothetical protein RFI_36301 [Reticulomyxa filosa]|uniref:Viral A-type inclusion protein n=1 Tax=Reticulomyxa filosa TaxID=46433 RepID=X6LHP3_RETFI|nr:hypothetical protein RFI_36301 [Reticulomyxa filosa]|eukprot:ETO01139.1 hypothetical protein RFI_36301 [Reticulomyxa filosa]
MKLNFRVFVICMYGPFTLPKKKRRKEKNLKKLTSMLLLHEEETKAKKLKTFSFEGCYDKDWISSLNKPRLLRNLQQFGCDDILFYFNFQEHLQLKNNEINTLKQGIELKDKQIIDKNKSIQQIQTDNEIIKKNLNDKEKQLSSNYEKIIKELKESYQNDQKEIEQQK